MNKLCSCSDREENDWAHNFQKYFKIDNFRQFGAVCSIENPWKNVVVLTTLIKYKSPTIEF